MDIQNLNSRKLNDLPPDLLVYIGMMLDFPDILSYCGASVKFNTAVCENDMFWMNRLIQDYPDYKKNKTEIQKEFYEKFKEKINYRTIYEISGLIKLKKPVNEGGLGLRGSLVDLYQLQELNLHFKQLTDLPKEIGNLRQLKKLVLVNNRLTTLPKESWWDESFFMFRFEVIATWLKDLLPSDIARYFQY